MKHTNPFRIIRRLALCLVWGGLLLSALAGCKKETPLSNLYDPDTVAELVFSDIDFSLTHLSTTDRSEIGQLSEILDRVKGTPAEPLDLIAQGISLTFHLENGDTFTMTFNNSDRRVYCVSRTADRKLIDSQWYFVSDDDRALVENYVSSLREKHLPFIDNPAPQEYLNERFVRISRMQWLNDDILQNEDVPSDQIDPLIAYLQEALTDLPHYGEKPARDAKRYMLSFCVSNYSSTLDITLHPDSNLIEICTEKLNNTYYFRLSDEQIETILTLSDAAG